MAKNIQKDSPKVLGLDVSTKTIGWALFDIESKNLLELTHISPIPKTKSENKIDFKIRYIQKKTGRVCRYGNSKCYY